MHRSRRARNLALAALAFALLAALAAQPASAEEPTIIYTHESLPTFEQQLASGQISSATFNKKVRSVHITLKDGSHVLVRYPAHGEPKIAAELKAHGIAYTVLKPQQASAEVAKKPVHHKLRYIVGGIVLAVIIVVAIVLLIDRRRKREAEE